jgi:hypothetical protein
VSFFVSYQAQDVIRDIFRVSLAGVCLAGKYFLDFLKRRDSVIDVLFDFHHGNAPV